MIYLDNAATGLPKGKEVIKAVKDSLIKHGNSGRSGHNFSLGASETIFSTRQEIANLFNAHPENVVLCNNATQSLNIAIKGLYKSETKILISDMEHNSVIRPAYDISDVKMFSVDINNDETTIQNFKLALTDDVSMVVITHASNICGRIIPIEQISDICKKHGKTLIVDASQTAGYVPIKVDSSHIDVLCFSGHKGLYGPMGTGIMIVNSNSNLSFKTIFEGGTGLYSNDKSMPTSLPERLEAGTIGVQNFNGLKAALKKCSFNNDTYHACYRYIIEELSNLSNIRLYGVSFENIDKYVPVILFNIDNYKADIVEKKLCEKGICARSGFHCAPLAHKKLQTGYNGAVRISIGKKNSLKECKKFISVIKNAFD